MIFLNDIETQARKTYATATSYTITVLVGSTVLVRNATMTKSGSVFTYPGLREIVLSIFGRKRMTENKKEGSPGFR